MVLRHIRARYIDFALPFQDPQQDNPSANENFNSGIITSKRQLLIYLFLFIFCCKNDINVHRNQEQCFRCYGIKVPIYHRADSRFAPSQWETSLQIKRRLSLAGHKCRISPVSPCNELYSRVRSLPCLTAGFVWLGSEQWCHPGPLYLLHPARCCLWTGPRWRRWWTPHLRRFRG